MTAIDRAELSAARARAGRIRQGIHNYLDTLSEISTAYEARDWATLGYEDWSSYVDEEYGAERLRLPAEHRQKAITELRLAGMSQRGIASALGVSKGTVQNDLAGGQDCPPEAVLGTDGKQYPAAPLTPPWAPEPEEEDDPETGPAPLVQAPTEVIEGTVERASAREPEWSEDELRMRDLVEGGGTAVASLRGAHANVIRWAEESNCYVRIDRRSEWGNPFEIPGDGDRLAVIDAFAYHYLPHKPSLMTKLDSLRGMVLGCWCSPEACHGDVLVAALEAP